jgi:RNA polymerase sigma-70 factor (ECF subfamily)
MTDADQFEAFVRRHQDMVFGTAVRLLGNPTEAEDIAQTVFLKAFQRFSAVAASESPAAWLKTVTRNACINHLSRYRARWKFFSELRAREGDDPPEYDVASAADPVPLVMEHADDRNRLEQALRSLPEHQRVPLALFHFEEMSYQDIADALRVTVGKIKTDIHRGREALRQQLEVRLKPDTPGRTEPDTPAVTNRASR